MAMSDKEREYHNEYQRQNYRRLGVKLYKGDAEAFEEYCRQNGTSVNAAFRKYVAECIGRPLEKRSESTKAAADDENQEKD